MTTKTVTFTDSSGTGFRWEAAPSQPTKIACRGTMALHEARDVARRFRRAGWSVLVRSECPGASELCSA